MKISIIVWHLHITFIIYFKYLFSKLQKKTLQFNYVFTNNFVSLAKTILKFKSEVTKPHKHEAFPEITVWH